MLETGRYTTISEIAKAEKINPSYVSPVLRLTLLAPATVEAILDGRTSAGSTLAEGMECFRSFGRGSDDSFLVGGAVSAWNVPTAPRSGAPAPVARRGHADGLAHNRSTFSRVGASGHSRRFSVRIN